MPLRHRQRARGAVMRCLAAALVTACAHAPGSARPAETVHGGRVYSAPALHPGRPLKILLSYDMEGLSGQNDWETFEASHPDRFKQGQALLAGDVNAVIEGLVAGGAQVIDVFDQHGSGQPDSIPDLPRELMDRRANPVFMSEAISGEQAAAKSYDALVLVGEHSKTGRHGFASHTVTMGIEVSVNGATITEAELKALQWGKFGVPVIFASGDDRLREDLRSLPWIQYVVVKHSTSASTADLIPVDAVHREMRDKAKLAVLGLAGAKVVRVEEPATIAIRAVPPANLDLLRDFPGLRYADHSVTFVAPSFTPEGFFQMLAVIEVASAIGRSDLLREMLEADPKTKGTSAKLADSYAHRWLEVESGRWPPR